MIGFATRLAFYVIVFNIFLSLLLTASGGEGIVSVSVPDPASVQERINRISEPSPLQPILYITWMSTVLTWNTLVSVIRSIFMTGTLIRSFVPLIPVEIEAALNTIFTVIIVLGLIEFIRGGRL